MKTILTTALLSAAISATAFASCQSTPVSERQPSSVVKKEEETCNKRVSNCERDKIDRYNYERGHRGSLVDGDL